MPTNTTSPSASSRAATAAIISAGVYAGLEAVVHPARVAFLRLEPGDQRRLFRHVRRAVGDAADVLLEVTLEPPGVPRDPLPPHLEIGAAAVIPLAVERARAPGRHT